MRSRGLIESSLMFWRQKNLEIFFGLLSEGTVGRQGYLVLCCQFITAM